jgi:5-methylcytosine-specific restriction protein B
MVTNTKELAQRNYWLVEADWDAENDQIERFISEGIWVNSFYDKSAESVNNIKPDDLIAIKSSFTRKIDDNKFVSALKIKATGVVTKNFNDGKLLEVSWNNRLSTYEVDNLIKTDTIHKLTDINEINAIFYPEEIPQDDYFEEAPVFESREHVNVKHPLNLIYYGPSGTGKTYKTMTTALEIIDGFFPADPLQAKKKYEIYRDLGQISFITFHDAYNYDDFVEGLKPVVSEEYHGQLDYQVKPGIFKEIAGLAKVELTTAPNKINFNPENEKTKFFKITMGTRSRERDDNTYSYCLSNNYISLDMLGGIDYSILENTVEWEQAQDEISQVYFYENEDAGQKRLGIQAIYYFKNYMKTNDIVFVANDHNNIVAIGRINGWYEFKDIPGVRYHHFRKVEWLIKGCNIPSEKFYKKKFSEQPIYELNKRYINLDNVTNFISTKGNRQRNYVLIIDEINKGNIHKIFGELVSLIEPQKRIGEPEELRVKLPYSNDEFGVPHNLYLIGTMNSAYQSESFDNTLRRRFEFVEMTIDYKQLNFKIDEIAIDKMLEKMNQRIKYLSENDFQIGHSYFIELKEKPSFESLRIIFKNKIIPLLQHYFSSDYQKICLVLGDNQKTDTDLQFIIIDEIKSEDLFGTKLKQSGNNKVYSLNLPDNPVAYIQIYEPGKTV